MRIIFLCTSSIVDASPQGRWIPIAHQLVKGGHEVHILMLHPMFDQLKAKQVVLNTAGTLVAQHVGQMHVYGKPGARRYFGPLQLLGITARATFELARHAIALKPDVIQVCKPQPMNGLAGLIASRWLNRPLHVDCDDYEAESNRFSSAWQKKLVQFFEDRLPRLAEAITVNTHFLFDRYRSLGIPADKIIYVTNGISTLNPQSLIPNPHPIVPKIVYVGTMSKISHGTDLLIAAFALLRRQFTDVRLVMVGDGDDRADLMVQAQRLGVGEAIDWVGRVPLAQTQAYYADAICSVDPVFDRPVMGARSPLKIVESLACGTPVVTGDVGDRGETLLGDKPCGVLVAPGNAQALADGFATLLLNPQLRAELAHNALTRANDFDWATLAQRWAGQYGAKNGLWVKEKPHAAIIHIFYVDLIQELLTALLPLKDDVDVYVTVPQKREDEFRAAILAVLPAARVLPVPNRGRDILPFMSVLAKIQHLDYGFILKIHGKKSKHLQEGARWRNEVVADLTSNRALLPFIANAKNNVALVAPRGHIVDGKKYIGGNLQKMRALLSMVNVQLDEAALPPFPAGSMYWIRKDIADDLLKISSQFTFEPERGQIDVTLAHAIERIVLALATRPGGNVVFTDLTDYRQHINRNYDFAADSAEVAPKKRGLTQKIMYRLKHLQYWLKDIF